MTTIYCDNCRCLLTSKTRIRLSISINGRGDTVTADTCPNCLPVFIGEDNHRAYLERKANRERRQILRQLGGYCVGGCEMNYKDPAPHCLDCFLCKGNPDADKLLNSVGKNGTEG